MAAAGRPRITGPAETGRSAACVHHVQGQNYGDQSLLDVEQNGRLLTGVAYVGAISASPPTVEAEPGRDDVRQRTTEPSYRLCDG